MKELGDLLDDGQAALVVVGHSKIGEQLDKDLQRAQKSVEKEIDADSTPLGRFVATSRQPTLTVGRFVATSGEKRRPRVGRTDGRSWGETDGH